MASRANKINLFHCEFRLATAASPSQRNHFYLEARRLGNGLFGQYLEAETKGLNLYP